MSFGDADLAYMLGQDFGYDVVYSGTTVKGQLDRRTVEVLQGTGGGVLAQDISVLVKKGSISPAIGSTLTVNSVSYTVRDILDEDESLTRLHLQTGV